MYQLRNGLLHKDGKPLFALGQSYYPSYHPQKVPVLEGGDRIGMMRTDLQAMKEAGFHLVRMAALGDIWAESGQVRMKLDLPDAFCRMCEEMELASMIRLQGYSVNLRGFEDTDMHDQDGNAMPFHWGWFIRSCLNHPGILEDNAAVTEASAAHFAPFPSVVSFQIYNEPAYPSTGLYDYHPATVAAFRSWLAAQGLAPEDPPRARPAAGQDAAPWVRWRLFLMQRMTDFLCAMGDKARDGYATPESLTCHMSCPVSPGAAIRGQDYFATAQRMDILGITAYIPHRGPSYHIAGLQLSLCESAASTFSKHAWLIEYNARTCMPPQEWQRETLAAIGHGLKGILYYQWRADYPFADGPEPEGFGMLFNNGEKAPHFDTGVAMNHLINRIGGQIATAEKARCGVGILYSNPQHALSDALENGAEMNVSQCRESSILALRRLYTMLSERSVPVDFARACDLAQNPLGIGVLLLPMRRGLLEAELDEIDAFCAQGGRAFLFQDDQLGFVPYQRVEKDVAHGVVYEQYDLATLLEMQNIVPPARVLGAPNVDARLLTAPDHAVCALINYDPLERSVKGAMLHVPALKYTSAMAYSLDYPEEGLPLRITDQKVSLPPFHYGAILCFTEEAQREG